MRVRASNKQRKALTGSISLVVGVLVLVGLVVGHADAQWEIATPAPTTADLRGIDYVGNGVAWASGTEGTVLRTEDSGYLWQRCSVPPGAEHLDFRGVQAFDANTAIVMSSRKGALSRLYKTTDGCQTWKLVFTNPDADGFWDALRFDTRTPELQSGDWRQHFRGFLVGDPVRGAFAIYETIDSGDTWHAWGGDKSERPAIARNQEALFAASNSSLVAPGINGPFAFVTGGEGGGRLFLPQGHSPFDNGTVWKFHAIELPMPSGKAAGAFSLATRRPESLFPDLMIVGGDYSKPGEPGAAVFIPNRASARNLFSSPARAATHPPHGYRSAVAYDAQTNTWITVGPNGTDISTDDGRNWRALRPNPALGDAPDADQHWNALSLPFAVGPHGRIGKLRADALKSISKTQ